MLLRHGTNAAWCPDMDGHVVAGQQAQPWAEVIPWKELGSVLGSFGPCFLLVHRDLACFSLVGHLEHKALLAKDGVQDQLPQMWHHGILTVLR